ncbi:MAG: hypothetical protein SGPRY_013718, partial [Prymnesium sp.]
DCVSWASRGECDENPAYMRTQCQYACGDCRPVSLEEMLEDLDTDGDGRIGLEEASCSVSAQESAALIRLTLFLLQLASHMQSISPGLDVSALQDKALTEAEILEWLDPDGPHGDFIRREFARLDVDKDGFLTSIETSRVMHMSSINELQMDEDGRIGFEQLKEYERIKFNLADGDSNGRLTDLKARIHLLIHTM